VETYIITKDFKTSCTFKIRANSKEAALEKYYEKQLDWDQLLDNLIEVATEITKEQEND
jgi:hypothetical protein